VARSPSPLAGATIFGTVASDVFVLIIVLNCKWLNLNYEFLLSLGKSVAVQY
jgi:hypothetical protein